MKSMKLFAIVPMLAAMSLGASMAYAANTNAKTSNAAYTVIGCEGGSETLEDVLGLNFCSPQAQALYKKHADQNKINFSNKYVLLHFTVPTELDKPDGTYWHNYVAVDPKTKTVYPLPFSVRDDELSKNIKVKANKASDELCIPARYSVEGNAMTGSYGGESGNGFNCFQLIEADRISFALEPTRR